MHSSRSRGISVLAAAPLVASGPCQRVAGHATQQRARVRRDVVASGRQRHPGRLARDRRPRSAPGPAVGERPQPLEQLREQRAVPERARLDDECLAERVAAFVLASDVQRVDGGRPPAHRFDLCAGAVRRRLDRAAQQLDVGAAFQPRQRVDGVDRTRYRLGDRRS